MAITITAITRVNAPPCQHWNITVNDNGVTRSAERHVPQVRAMFEAFPGGFKEALVLAYILYRLDISGETLAQIVNDVVVS